MYSNRRLKCIGKQAMSLLILIPCHVYVQLLNYKKISVICVQYDEEY